MDVAPDPVVPDARRRAGHGQPTIRQLAADLGLATNTVARAYRQLESHGLVQSRVRHGTTVAARPRPTPGAQNHLPLTEAARVYLATAYQLGASPEQATAALHTAIAEATGS